MNKKNKQVDTVSKKIFLGGNKDFLSYKNYYRLFIESLLNYKKKTRNKIKK